MLCLKGAIETKWHGNMVLISYCLCVFLTAMSNKEGIEMKTILKRKKPSVLLNDEESTTQSSSLCAVRWNLPDENVQAHSSAPTMHASSLTKHSQQQSRQSSLRDLRSLQECVEFIQHWKEQVDELCKQGGRDPGGETSKKQTNGSDRKAERSLEESRKLILEWSDELQHVDELLKENPWTPEGQKTEREEDKDPKEEAQQRIMEWAKELQRATESCGVPCDELGKVLRLLGLKKKRLFRLLPLLEFITWSLLKEDSTTMVPQLWLLAKQRTWKAGIPRYIPNSVWSWICSAAADVILDPKTHHSWLQLSDDQRKVQEGLSELDVPHSSQRFDHWPCVLGWEGYSAGRHYWEVDIANNGYWRIGLTTSNAQRKGNIAMKPKKGYWVLWRSNHHFYACTKPETQLPIGLVPRRLGVYLDYEEGQISFYNAQTKSHIYTFTGTFREKLYPLFAPMDGRTLLTIIEPKKITSN
ncbi:transcript variant X3 [Nothobranchius furzeri]|uniref:Transcript variant X3 n=2 Tax=Nothobranchius furzeri TaxID=105023 RepID=A0A9D2Z123_NOTFU|nr:transcript variant X3 [Nothobranchius furzeri]